MKKLLIVLITATVCSLNITSQTATTDEGVIINGVKWATRNVDLPGVFVDKPENAGMFYQWSRKVAWTTSDPIKSSNGETIWDISMPSEAIWGSHNDPSPAGWRIPSIEEINKLLDTNQVSNEWATVNGVNGRKFVDKKTNNSLFLPAAGYRYGALGELFESGSDGYYWSSSPNEDYKVGAFNLNFSDIYAEVNCFIRRDGHTIRCVAE